MKITKSAAQFYVELFESTPKLAGVFAVSGTPEIAALAIAYEAYTLYEMPADDVLAISTYQQQVDDLGVLANDDTFIIAMMECKGNKADRQIAMSTLMAQRATAPVQIDIAKAEIVGLQSGALTVFQDTYHTNSGSRTNTGGERSNIVGQVVECTFKNVDLDVAVLSETDWNVWEGHTVVLASVDLEEKHKVRTLTAARKVAAAYLGISQTNVTIAPNSPISIDKAIADKVFNKIACSGSKNCKVISEDAQAWEHNMRNQNGETLGKID